MLITHVLILLLQLKSLESKCTLTPRSVGDKPFVVEAYNFMGNKGLYKIYNANRQAILVSYAETKSAHKTGKNFGISGASLYGFLEKEGIQKHRIKSNTYISELKELYSTPLLRGDKRISDFCVKHNIHKSTLSSHAGKLGLSSSNRKFEFSSIQKLKESLKSSSKENHYTPFKFLTKEQRTELGVKASIGISNYFSNPDNINKIRESSIKRLKTRIEKYGTFFPCRKNGSWKFGKRIIGDNNIFFRSRWEANYARYLNYLLINSFILKWDYEPDVFIFKMESTGTLSYTPDFKVVKLDGKTEYHEVKGWMDDRSKMNLARMEKHYPEISVVVVGAKWFASNNSPGKYLIEEWEK